MKVIDPWAGFDHRHYRNPKSCPMCSGLLLEDVRGIVFDRDVFDDWPTVWLHAGCVDRYKLNVMRVMLSGDEMATSGGG